MTLSTADRWGRLRKVVAEFLIIVTGVLVALGVDEWRHAREDHALELEYASRLRADLQRDVAQFGDFERTALATKASTLLRLSQFTGEPPHFENAMAEMQALEYSQYIALPAAQSGTFREMESTGKLALLRNPSLRSALAEHYAEHELMSGILQRPIGPYRELLNGALSGGTHYAWLTEGRAVTASDLDRAVRDLLKRSDFQEAANAELAYAGKMLVSLRESRSRAERLLAQLDREYPR